MAGPLPRTTTPTAASSRLSDYESQVKAARKEKNEDRIYALDSAIKQIEDALRDLDREIENSTYQLKQALPNSYALKRKEAESYLLQLKNTKNELDSHRRNLSLLEEKFRKDVELVKMRKRNRKKDYDRYVEVNVFNILNKLTEMEEFIAIAFIRARRALEVASVGYGSQPSASATQRTPMDPGQMPNMLEPNEWDAGLETEKNNLKRQGLALENAAAKYTNDVKSYKERNNVLDKQNDDQTKNLEKQLALKEQQKESYRQRLKRLQEQRSKIKVG